jgi:hypothetical protein
MRLTRRKSFCILLLVFVLAAIAVLGGPRLRHTTTLAAAVQGLRSAASIARIARSYDDDGSAPAPSALLLIIQGGYRTLDLTLDSILRNLCHANGGCHIALSLANTPDVVSHDVRIKLQPHLVAEYYREPSDLSHPHYIFEYQQTLKPLQRLSLARYAYVMRIRADCYVSVPIPVMSAMGAGPHFDRDWAHFGDHLPEAMQRDSRARLKAWLFTGGVPQLIPKLVLQTAPPMAWSPINSAEFNAELVWALDALPEAPNPADPRVMQPIVRELAARHRLLYISGGLFLHFGTTADMLEVTSSAFDHWRSGPGTTLTWQGEFPHSAKAQAWSQPISQEANIRLTHRRLKHAMIDLHNSADYLASFTWKYYGLSMLSKARGLTMWLLRPRQVKFRHVPGVRETRFWRAIDDAAYPNPDESGTNRPLVLSHGCLSDSTPAEMADCFQEERDQ